MKTLLICHDGAEIDEKLLARWLGSFSVLSGIIVLKENKSRVFKRIRNEINRSGLLRFFDILAFRIYYKLFQRAKDSEWEKIHFGKLYEQFTPLTEKTEYLYTHSPNTQEAKDFISKLAPDIMIARCKQLLKKDIFTLPAKGTFVLHPGITPEYRNAYGCFWAIANSDYNKVGTTLLKIDEGVDTGPVYGYYSYNWDALNESHLIIQHRTILENLDLIKDKLIDIYKDTASVINTSGRKSGAYGQPWLSKYLSIRRHAKDCQINKERDYEGNNTPVS